MCLFHLRRVSFIILKHLATPEEKNIRFYEFAVMCEHVFIFFPLMSYFWEACPAEGEWNKSSLNILC